VISSFILRIGMPCSRRFRIWFAAWFGAPTCPGTQKELKWAERFKDWQCNCQSAWGQRGRVFKNDAPGFRKSAFIGSIN